MNKCKIFCLMISSVALLATACTENGMLLHSSGKDYIMQDVNGVYKIGGRYQINGVWYQPKEDFKYKQDGIASWYGDDFHKGTTANGETYNMYAMSASHKTLPLPSVAKVTNLENGKSVIVRINDRGPFVNHRIIDVSKAVAQKLGFLDAGTARVRVEIMEKESRELKQKILDNGGRIVDGSPISDQTVVSENDPSVTQSVALFPSKSVPAENENSVIYSPTNRANAITKPVNTLNKGYYIQLGAFKNYDNALAVQKRFQFFEKPKIMSVNNADTQLYRVRIGPFTSPEAAVKAMDDIYAKTQYNDMRLVEEK